MNRNDTIRWLFAHTPSGYRATVANTDSGCPLGHRWVVIHEGDHHGVLCLDDADDATLATLKSNMRAGVRA